MDVGIAVPDIDGISDPELAAEIESLGYSSIWCGELWGDDAFVRLTHIADSTNHVSLGTAVVNVFSRSPAVLAMASSTLARKTAKRFRLGLGPGTKPAVENLHGHDYHRPVRRVHETVEIIMAILSQSGAVSYDGDLLDVSEVPPLPGDVSIFNAALGPANRRVTGYLCDGWIPHNIPFDYLGEAYATIREAAAERNRDPRDITVAPFVPVCVSGDAFGGRDAIRGLIAYYVGNSTGYRRAIGYRFPEVAPRIAELWTADRHEQARARVTDEMVDSIGIAGTPSDIRTGLHGLMERDVIDEFIVQIPSKIDDEVKRRTIETVAESIR